MKINIENKNINGVPLKTFCNNLGIEHNDYQKLYRALQKGRYDFVKTFIEIIIDNNLIIKENNG